VNGKKGVFEKKGALLAQLELYFQADRSEASENEETKEPKPDPLLADISLKKKKRGEKREETGWRGRSVA